MLRVNHAGEYGAKRIYEGQLAVLRGRTSGPIIEKMYAQELVHLEYFNKELPRRRVRPTALFPFWHVAGFALGAATAMLGERAAMACTVAVEEVIDEHYAKQIEKIKESEPELAGTLEKFRQEEVEHRDTGLAHEAEKAPGHPLLTALVKTSSRAAIWLSTRV